MEWAGVHQQAHKLDTNSIYLQSFLGMLLGRCRGFQTAEASSRLPQLRLGGRFHLHSS